MKILIVEDDKTNSMFLKGIFSPYGEVETAMNGVEALATIERELDQLKKPFDLICLDISMPELDGMSTLVKLRELEESRGHGGLGGSKVIMTTAYDSPKDILGAFKKGCEAYIVKPINREKLFEQVRALGLPLTEASKT